MGDFIKNHLPKFEPYDKIIVGSNVVKCKYLVKFSDYIPLIISKGRDYPYIWMYVINKKQIYPIIVGNVVLSKNISFSLDQNLHRIKVSVKKDIHKSEEHIFFDAEFTDKEFHILYMDLRFLGIDIQSNDKALYVGGNTIQGCSASGIETFIG